MKLFPPDTWPKKPTKIKNEKYRKKFQKPLDKSLKIW